MGPALPGGHLDDRIKLLRLAIFNRLVKPSRRTHYAVPWTGIEQFDQQIGLGWVRHQFILPSPLHGRVEAVVGFVGAFQSSGRFLAGHVVDEYFEERPGPRGAWNSSSAADGCRVGRLGWLGSLLREKARDKGHHQRD